MKILLVEDDERLGDILSKVLKSQGFEVDWAQDGEECFDYVNYNSDNPYDVILLDWMLPNKNGDIICKELRDVNKYNFSNGIIFLTAKDSMNDKVTGLELGADDYIVKPFENAELIARLKSVNRRKSKSFIGEISKFGNITLNKTEHTLSSGDKTAKLSRIEFLLFDLLLSNQNKIVTRETISDNVWGFNEEVSQASIDSYVYMLRKKLKSLSANIAINLYKGIGYKMEALK